MTECGILPHRLALLEGEEKIIAIGVATPGPVDVKKGRIINPGHFHEIRNLDVTDTYREALWHSGFPGP